MRVPVTRWLMAVEADQGSTSRSGDAARHPVERRPSAPIVLILGDGEVAIDSAGDVYVLDEKNHRIQKFAPTIWQGAQPRIGRATIVCGTKTVARRVP
jgi:hypothetical protein